MKKVTQYGKKYNYHDLGPGYILGRNHPRPVDASIKITGQRVAGGPKEVIMIGRETRRQADKIAAEMLRDAQRKGLKAEAIVIDHKIAPNSTTFGHPGGAAWDNKYKNIFGHTGPKKSPKGKPPQK